VCEEDPNTISRTKYTTVGVVTAIALACEQNEKQWNSTQAHRHACRMAPQIPPTKQEPHVPLASFSFASLLLLFILICVVCSGPAQLEWEFCCERECSENKPKNSTTQHNTTTTTGCSIHERTPTERLYSKVPSLTSRASWMTFFSPCSLLVNTQHTQHTTPQHNNRVLERLPPIRTY
jgi:hypothetical protein